MTLKSQSAPEFSAEFIEENKKFEFKNSKKGGRYSKAEKDKRQNEVYRLHFEYGYSGRKIADLMKISRHTVNSDIDYWFARIYKNINIINPEGLVVLSMHRLEIQRTRLREQLDKENTFQEKMAIERLMYDIENKIVHTCNRLSESTKGQYDFYIEKLNQDMKERHEKTRYLSFNDKMSVSLDAYEKISEIIKQDGLRTKLF